MSSPGRPQRGIGMPYFPTSAAVLRFRGFKIFSAFFAVTLFAGQPRMTKSERTPPGNRPPLRRTGVTFLGVAALQRTGSMPPSRIAPLRLRRAFCYAENSFRAASCTTQFLSSDGWKLLSTIILSARSLANATQPCPRAQSREACSNFRAMPQLRASGITYSPSTYPARRS